MTTAIQTASFLFLEDMLRQLNPSLIPFSPSEVHDSNHDKKQVERRMRRPLGVGERCVLAQGTIQTTQRKIGNYYTTETHQDKRLKSVRVCLYLEKEFGGSPVYTKTF